ncbi:MAG: hypothetical protein HYX49_05115 [Chloroflexi bacterium]|nr:hypothetical protein [Chloroflexota bacterium]
MKKIIADDFEFLGETTLTLDPPLRACWMKIGEQNVFRQLGLVKNRSGVSLDFTTG